MSEISEFVEQGRDAQVPQQMENLKGRLFELEESIANLKTRLSCVLRDDTLSDDKKAREDSENLVSLANDIKQIANQVITVNINIATILRELEL